MPLDYADFAHNYERSNACDAENRQNFEHFANFLECLARLFWPGDPSSSTLGISLDSDTLSLFDELESGNALDTTFNSAASDDAAGKSEL